jgi:hypothetical protein
MNVMEKEYKHHTKEQAFEILKAVLASPIEYKNDAVLGAIVEKLLPKEELSEPEISLNNTGVHFNTFGAEHIEQGAFHQMYTAVKLPVAVAGALCQMHTMVMVCQLVVYWQQTMQLYLMVWVLILVVECVYQFLILTQRS